MTIESAVGHDVPRVDGWPKVSGGAEYLTDMALPNMAHAAVVRSPHPRATVTGIDPSPALAVPGVLAVLSAADVADLPPVRIFADSPPVQRILTATPQFTGDAVAAVVAETAAAARQGVLATEVAYEPLPPVLSAADARDGGVQLHPAAPGNRAGPPININRGDVEGALADCAHVFADSFTTQRQCAQTIEPLACICDWTGDDLDVWTHLDSMFHFRDALAEALAIDPHRARIHPPEALGASFGLKNSLIASLEPLAALCSRTVGRPVKLALSPEESMSATVTRHAAGIDLVAGVDDDGILLARSADVLLDSGAYGWGYVVALSMVGKWASLYRTEHLRFSATSVYTNHIPGGAYRSVGTAQIHFAMESQLDDIARSLGIDPVELRRRNLARVGDPLSFGTTIRSFGAEACLDRGSAAAGWAPSEPRPGLDPLGRSRGRGMAMGMHHAGLTGLTPVPEVSRCDVELEADGTVSIRLGVIDKGQGALTTLTLVAADELGLAPERIRLHNLGTAGVPLDFWGAEASRTTYVMGRAVADGARKLRAAVRARFDVEPAELTPERIAAVHADAGDRNRSAAGTATRPQHAADSERTAAGTSTRPQHAGNTGPIAVEGYFAPSDSDPLPVVGAHFCEVEVDHATGQVRVLRYVAAQDVGRVINPLGCRGQVEGGLHHGIGYALLEELRHDEGAPLNPNFMGYKVLMASDMPEIEVVLVEEPDPDGGPHGAKGVGTPVIPAIAPAVANAVRDAIGVRLRDLPMTPPRVLAALLGDW